MKEKIEVKTTGLKCDNINCDWKDTNITFDQMSSWINKPCPKCGENVLTYEDHKRAMIVKESIDRVNSLPEDVLDGMVWELDIENPNKIVKIAIDTHNKISIKKIDDGK